MIVGVGPRIGTAAGPGLHAGRAGIEDFAGDYGAVSGGLTVIKGLDAGALLSNDNCVYINADSESEGVRMSAPAPSGILIKLQEW